MKHNIFEIANWFLSKSAMTPKKLQKLCYYAQAWSLALNHRKIITSNFEAWVHGPVNRELYFEYKEYGWTLIKRKKKHNITNEQDLELLKSVWLTYGEYDGQQLEELTHNEVPWQKARRNLKPLENSSNIISDDHMQEYYKSIYIGD